MSNQKLASLFHLSLHAVRTILQARSPIEQNKTVNRAPRKKRLTLEQQDFLLCANTLQKWKNMSLARRTIQFHRQYPETTLSVSTLRALYHRHQIKWKVMSIAKKFTPNKFQEIITKRMQQFRHVLKIKNQNLTIIYLDETLFKPYNIAQKSWAHKGDNQVASKQGITLDTIAAVVCVSQKHGLLDYVLRKKSIRTAELLILVQRLGKMLPTRRVVIFMDNLRSHYNKQLVQRVKDMGWQVIYNAPYSPQFHCIEQLFALVKQRYRQGLTDCDFAMNNTEHMRLIKCAIQAISSQLVVRVEQKHFKKMTDYISEHS